MFNLNACSNFLKTWGFAPLNFVFYCIKNIGQTPFNGSPSLIFIGLAASPMLIGIGLISAFMVTPSIVFLDALIWFKRLFQPTPPALQAHQPLPQIMPEYVAPTPRPILLLPSSTSPRKKSGIWSTSLSPISEKEEEASPSFGVEF